MKFKKSAFIITTLIVASLAILIYSCNKNDLPNENTETTQSISGIELLKTSDPEIQKEVEYLKNELKISPENLQLRGEDYIIDGDAFIPRKQLQEMIHSSSGDVAAKHRKYNYMCSAGAKTIYINSSVPTSWKTAISQACSEYNARGLTITFTTNTTTSTTVNNALVALMYSQLPSTAVAETAYPGTNNAIGIQMRINPSYNTTTTASQKKQVMVHEIGHALGFMHTDTQDGIALNSWNFSCVPFSCDGIDNSSVYRKGTSPIGSWNGFSYCDQQILDCFY